MEIWRTSPPLNGPWRSRTDKVYKTIVPTRMNDPNRTISRPSARILGAPGPDGHLNSHQFWGPQISPKLGSLCCQGGCYQTTQGLILRRKLLASTSDFNSLPSQPPFLFLLSLGNTDPVPGPLFRPSPMLRPLRASGPLPWLPALACPSCSEAWQSLFTC